jgi:hypothetical protein
MDDVVGGNNSPIVAKLVSLNSTDANVNVGFDLDILFLPFQIEFEKSRRKN